MTATPSNRPPSRSTAAVIEAKDVVAGYLPGVNILNGCSLVAYPGEMIGIIGPNGAGKSTLLKAMFGLVKIRSGSVHLGTQDITNLRANTLVEMGVGFVPQNNNVFPSLTIEENLQMGLFLRPKKIRERLDAMWDLFPALHERRSRSAGALSGGERQSLAMARALMMEPSVLLLDEPSAGLSPVRQDETFIRTRRINKTGVCVVMVEQNARRCLQICDRGYVLDQGKDAYTGTGRELANDPKVIQLYLGTLAEDVESKSDEAGTRPSRPASRRRGSGPVEHVAPLESSYVAGGQGDEHAAHDHRTHDGEPAPVAHEGRQRAGEHQPDRPRDERADHVEGVDPGQLVRVDLLLDRKVPADAEDLEAEAVQPRTQQHDDQRVGPRHGQRERRGQGQEAGADEEGVPGPPAQRDQPADHEAEHHRRQRPTPGGAAERVADHDRAEHALRTAVEEVVEQGLEDEQPQPRVPHDLAETGRHVAPQARLGARSGHRGHPDLREQRGGDRERERVEGQRPAAADPDHQQPGHAAADDHRDVLGDPAPRDRALQELERDGLLGDRRRAGAAQRAQGAVEHAQDGQQRDAGPATDQRERHEPLTTAAAAADPWSITLRGSRSPRTPPNSTAPTSASA